MQHCIEKIPKSLQKLSLLGVSISWSKGHSPFSFIQINMENLAAFKMKHTFPVCNNAETWGKFSVDCLKHGGSGCVCGGSGELNHPSDFLICLGRC